MSIIGQRLLWHRTQYYLKRHHPTLVGIGGSRGKSLVKNSLPLLLPDQRLRTSTFNYGDRRAVAKSIVGSFWQELARPKPDAIVLELDASTPGEIDYFARTLSFQVAVVTNIHSQNLHLFNNLDLLAHEQTSLVASLKKRSFACLNHDDPRVAAMAQHTKANIIWFGTSHGNDVRLVRATRLSNLGFACEFNVQGTPLEIHLPRIIGSHQLLPIAGALAATLALNGNVRTTGSNLNKLGSAPGQMQLQTGRYNEIIINDTFDSTPESMLAGLDTLAEISAYAKRPSRSLAILGDIANLGAYSVNWHENIGRAASATASLVVAVGTNMRAAGAAALEHAQQLKRAVDVHRFNDAKSAGDWLARFTKPNDIIYIAGGREMNMAEAAKQISEKDL